MTLANLEIKRNEATLGGFKFIVDGHELKGVRNFTLSFPRDDAPVATVAFLVGGVDIDASALLELQAAYICRQADRDVDDHTGKENEQAMSKKRITELLIAELFPERKLMPKKKADMSKEEIAGLSQQAKEILDMLEGGNK